MKKAADMRSLRVSDFKFRRDLFWLLGDLASGEQSRVAERLPMLCIALRAA